MHTHIDLYCVRLLITLEIWQPKILESTESTAVY